MDVRISGLDEFAPDPVNSNRGTERGMGLLEDSLRECGAGRSIVADKNGVVIAGNKTLEKAVALGFEEAIVVKTDGHQLVVVQREDLDLSSGGRARRLALADNRVGEINLEWDAASLQALKEMDEELCKGLWTDDEWEKTTREGELYSKKIEPPIYEPKGEKPRVAELYDEERANRLLEEIEKSPFLSEEERRFLTVAAARHTVLHFNKIADFYAHSSDEVKRLMEDSALVIIDFDRAIELGYVELTREIAEQVEDEYPD